MSLEDTLASTAEKIAVNGTHSERTVLEELAITARGVCPGAAAALVDWNGPEIARLRAFGVVHGALLRKNATLLVEKHVCLDDAASTVRAA